MKEGLKIAAVVWLSAGVGLLAGQTSGSQGTATPGQRQAGASADKSNVDAVFMRQAAEDNIAEIEHGRLASKNASAADVRQFGQRMVDDHTKASSELKALASKNGVTLPTELPAKHKAMQDKLSKLKGAEFDKAYMSHMVTAHQQDVGLFEKHAKSGKDPDTRAWAEKTLPVLQQHLKMARDVSAKLGKTTGGK